MPSTERAMIEDNRERYINPYTDFGFKKLFEQAEIARFTPEERRGYEDSMKNYRDINNAIATAQRDSKAEGKAEGKAEQNLENARKMKELGASFDFITQVTGLSPEQIEKL